MTDGLAKARRQELAALRRLGRKRDQAVAKVEREIVAEVKRLKSHYGMAEMAECVGLSRQGLYDLVKRSQTDAIPNERKEA